MTWTASIDATGYRISYTSSGGDSGSADVSGDSHTLTGLELIFNYLLSVPAPGQVNVVVSGITATSISLSWSVASGSVARSEVVWRETDRGTESSSGSLTGTSYTIDQLESTTIYTVTVRASNVAGTTDRQLVTFSTGIYSYLCHM